MLATPCYRPARWTDAQGSVQQLLAVLPLLPTAMQQRIWQHWQYTWQSLHAGAKPSPQALQPLAHPQRRQLDAVPFAHTLLAQLAYLSPPRQQVWAGYVLQHLLSRHPASL